MAQLIDQSELRLELLETLLFLRGKRTHSDEHFHPCDPLLEVFLADLGKPVRWHPLFQKDEHVPIQRAVIEVEVPNRERPIETGWQNRIHALSFLRVGFSAPLASERMRASSAEAGSSFGSCGTSSPQGFGEEGLRELIHVRLRLDKAGFELVGEGEQLLRAADDFALFVERWQRDAKGANFLAVDTRHSLNARPIRSGVAR